MNYLWWKTESNVANVRFCVEGGKKKREEEEWNGVKDEEEEGLGIYIEGEKDIFNFKWLNEKN